MPFKNLSAPRKVADLGAEARASAFLASPGLVAVLSTDPVKLAVVPTSGSGSKITNTSLDSGEDVALLSRDVALVRSGDGAVWALLDVTHTPKMEEVARDARAFAACPSGKSALIVSWDGSASLLSLDKNEVTARSFPVRGDLRACDLSETETYALMEGDGGGQLRVHPGPTPEPGASVRVPLPSEAKSLDRVRGGAKLSAVYRRGDRSVCLVHGGPNAFKAKAVRLEDKPTDIAVCETSLIAVFEDGRAALYDADAIANAEAGATLEARHTLTLGAQGAPRTVTISGKGSPTLWIGTSAGEVLSVAVIRKQG